MSSPRTFRHALVAAFACTALLSGASLAVAQPSRPAPTAVAKKAGVEAGNAYLGWRNPSVAGRATDRRTGDRLSTTAATSGGVQGIDVASYQGNVNWAYWSGQGKKFAYVKATEGTSYRNPYFGSQYRGSYNAGLIRGAYHFAVPNRSSGTAQADYFTSYGGGWSRDGRTLPGVLDVEYNPYGSICYGMTKTQMVSWIKAFTTRYKQRTGRDAVIYTNLDWWSQCTGNSTAFRSTNPLWVARYSATVGTLPGSWGYYTFWQYTSSPLDQNRFSADYTRLVALANG